MSCTVVRIGFFPAQLYNEERIWHFYVNKSNEEPRQVLRSKEIIQNSQKVLVLCMIIKLKKNLFWFDFFADQVFNNNANFKGSRVRLWTLFIKISLDFVNISNRKCLLKIATKLKIYSILFLFRFNDGLSDQLVRFICLPRQTKISGGLVK